MLVQGLVLSVNELNAQNPTLAFPVAATLTQDVEVIEEAQPEAVAPVEEAVVEAAVEKVR